MSSPVVTTIAGPASISVAVGTPIANTAAGVVPHAATHATGGGDTLTLGQAQITGLVADLAAKATAGEAIAYAIALG